MLDASLSKIVVQKGEGYVESLPWNQIFSRCVHAGSLGVFMLRF